MMCHGFEKNGNRMAQGPDNMVDVEGIQLHRVLWSFQWLVWLYAILSYPVVRVHPSVDQSRVFFGKRWLNAIKLSTVEFSGNETTILNEFNMCDAFKVPPIPLLARHDLATTFDYPDCWNISIFHGKLQFGGEWNGRHTDFPTVSICFTRFKALIFCQFM